MSARSGASASPRGGGHPGHDRLEQLGDADAFLGADDGQDLLGLGADQVHDLLRALLGLGARQVDLVEDRNDLEPGVHARGTGCESVCAWIPCDASTTRIAPSHAASERETS